MVINKRANEEGRGCEGTQGQERPGEVGGGNEADGSELPGTQST